MIVKRLELKNFQVIKEFNADFEGNIYFITGDNELGKSTLLKAIVALLTGNRDAVLRNGEDKGFAKMVVGDDGEEYEVELRFTKANPRGTLSIKQKTTGMRSDNVSMLQRVFGYTDFDAVDFSRWSETAEGRRKQVECVRQLLPENIRKRIAEIDTEVARTKDNRKLANANLKTYTTIYENADKQLKPGDLKTYANKIDITELLKQQQENAQLIEKKKTVASALEMRQKQLDELQERENEAKKQYESTLAQIADLRKDYIERIKNAETWLSKYAENNPEDMDVTAQLEKAEAHNKIHALVMDFLEKKQQKENAEKVAREYDEAIENLVKEKENLIASSSLPISGLTFTDDGLELNGVPFIAGKVSDSQIMEVATKLIIASNPTVKVFRIARGESLGAARLQSLIDLAKKEGYQGFIEEVKRGQDDLVIEEYTETE